jgi:tetratricopeptide (TPR) repeat protein
LIEQRPCNPGSQGGRLFPAETALPRRLFVSSPYQHPASDLHIATLVARLSASLGTLPAELERHREALEKGASLGSLRGITDEENRVLYQVACRLCDDNQFHHAFPLALQLVAHQPHDSRFAFLCASCLQRTGKEPDAALFYAICLDLDSTDAAAAYRLGECLEAMCHAREAMETYAKAVDICRGQFHYAAMQDMAQARIDQLAY